MDKRLLTEEQIDKITAILKLYSNTSGVFDYDESNVDKPVKLPYTNMETSVNEIREIRGILKKEKQKIIQEETKESPIYSIKGSNGVKYDVFRHDSSPIPVFQYGLVFWINKATWTDEYIQCIQNAIEYSNVMLMIDGTINGERKVIQMCMTCLYDFEGYRKEIEFCLFNDGTGLTNEQLKIIKENNKKRKEEKK